MNIAHKTIIDGEGAIFNGEPNCAGERMGEEHLPNVHLYKESEGMGAVFVQVNNLEMFIHKNE